MPKRHAAATLGAAIKQRREKRGMTQRQLAASMQVSQALICYYEQGAKAPSVARLRKLADALGCRPSLLMACLDQPATARMRRKRLSR